MPEAASIRLAFAQLAATEDKTANLAGISAAVARVAPSSDVVVLPENAMYTIAAPGQPWIEAAEPIDGPFVRTLSALAVEHAVTIVAGFTERVDDERGRVANTVVALSPDGEVVGSYRKAHLFDAHGFRESDYTAAGEPEAFVFPVDGIRVGILICYDLRFPESARLLADAGADVMVFPAAWAVGPGKAEVLRTLAAARAIENVCYVVACSQTGPLSTGFSLAVDPLGAVVAAAAEQPSETVVTIDRARVESARARVPSLDNRRLAVVPRGG